MIDRFAKRLELAERLYKDLTRRELLTHGITRVASITGLDIIGVPIFTATRPAGRTISINSGKHTNITMARSGAVLEAIEYNTAENPPSLDNQTSGVAPWKALKPILPLSAFPKVRGSIIHEDLPTAYETVDILSSSFKGAYAWVPSSLVWMCPRSADPFAHFCSSSNGLAIGFDALDAMLSALYEVIERDAWSIYTYSQDMCSKIWPRIELKGLPLADHLKSKGLEILAYDATTDVGVPVVGAMLFDPTNDKTGMFGGWGCHRDPIVAVERAILEAIQSRARYIAGARDDLMRRSFLIMKQAPQKELIEIIKSHPTAPFFSKVKPITMDQELIWLVDRLRQAGFLEIYAKTLAEYKLAGNPLTVVRVIVPGLVPPRFDGWQPTPRVLKYASA